jgi:tubulysin polyketide synthase-like protein
MTPDALLAELRARGVELTADGDALCYRGPKGSVTPELRALLVEQKPALLRLLTPRPTVTDPALNYRVAAFQAQVERWATTGQVGVPLLALPGAPEPRIGACLSCGKAIEGGLLRCSLCRHAVDVVLGLKFIEDDPA